MDIRKKAAREIGERESERGRDRGREKERERETKREREKEREREEEERGMRDKGIRERGMRERGMREKETGGREENEETFGCISKKFKTRKIPEKIHRYTREKKCYYKGNREKNRLISLKYLADGKNIIRTSVLTSM